MKNSVVFGGAGFLGSHVADALSQAGHNVTVFDQMESKYLQDNQKVVVGSLFDLDAVKNVVAGMDYVYNFAAIAGIKEASDNPLETIQTNIIGNTNILEACRGQNVSRFVYASTIYVYSEMASFYRVSKQASEMIIEGYQKKFGIDYTILRYGSLYGPRANEFNFIKKVIEQAIRDKKIKRKGDGEEVRDYIHVADAAHSSVDILSDDYKNQNVMITGSQTTKVSEILNMISEIFDNNIEIEYLPERIEEHYKVTPYSFRPKVAKKILMKNYHDLGQGLLDCIYEVYSEIGVEESGLRKISSQMGQDV